MNRLLITITAICICFSGYAQKVGGLKGASGSHSGSGSRSGGSSHHGSSGGSYSDVDPDCLCDGCNGLLNLFSLFNWNNENKYQSNNNEIPNVPSEKPDTQSYSRPKEPVTKDKEAIDKNETPPEIPFEKMSISVRGSFYPAGFHVWVPEISVSKGNFSYSVRLLSVAEQQIDKTEYYSTFDFQPLQINFVNKHNFLFKMGMGGMAETFSGKVYFELTTNANWRVGKKFDMGIEGRMATDHGIVRQEASVHANYALWQKDNKQFLVGLQGMISEYFQKVDVNTCGFSAGFRF